MNARDKALRDARKGAYEDQRELRSDIREIVNGVVEKADVRQMVRAALDKRKEVDAFAAWLKTAKPPKEAAAIAKWIAANKDTAFSGYNVYLLQLSNKISKAVLDSGIVKRVDGIADRLNQGVNEWLAKFPQKTGAK